MQTLKDTGSNDSLGMQESMLERIYNTIIKHKLIDKGDNVIVGISGGPDSVCLLHALVCLSERLGIKIYAAHVNHMLRGDESDRDEKYVSELCRNLGTELYAKSFNVKGIAEKMKLSLEEAGRQVRYEFFDELSEKLGNAKIAVAHNKNDQAETVLMNMFRGAGLEGLRGMDYKRGKIIRPLLDIERSDIEEYCRKNSLQPRTDSSNTHAIYTRNKIRLELIPNIQKLLGINLINTLSRMSDLIKIDSDFINMNALESYHKCIKNLNEDQAELDLAKLADLHPAIMSRVIRLALNEIKGDLKGIENIHIKNVENLILKGRTGAVVQLPGKLRVARSYRFIKIYREKENRGIPEFNIKMNIPGKTDIEALEACIEAEIIENRFDSNFYKNIKNNAMEQFFDYDILSEGINIRQRRKGDKFRPCGSKGTKKLKEYFIDQKVPKEIRDSIPLVATGSDIVWIIGYKINDKFKVTENTRNVLKLKYIKK